MKKRINIKKLLTKYRNGVSSEVEIQKLLQGLEENSESFDMLDKFVIQEWRKQSLIENPPKPLPKGRKIRYLYYYIAVASAILLVFSAFLFWNISTPDIIHYTTGNGERSMIELPDGSQVELNANSQLSWDDNWQRSGVRLVILEGEAYFDVVKSGGLEFQVLADETLVKVLGTSFNVSNRRGATEIFLNEGKVELEIPNIENLILAPGEKVSFEEKSNKIFKTEHETLRSAAAWKTGVIAFQKQALKDILPELNDIYGIHLVCRDSLLNERMMDVGVPYMDWEATKTSLELAMNVEIVEVDGEYIIESPDGLQEIQRIKED